VSLTESECINELNELKDISLLDIVQYIKNSIDVIVTLKLEEKKK
jgi:predicted amidohydrolase